MTAEQPGARRQAILARLVVAEGRVSTLQLCEVAAEVAALNGAGIMLMSGDLMAGSVATTDDVAAAVEDLQYTLGEGPCLDAHHEGRPVLEADLDQPARPRWPVFAPEALAAGVRAIFGFPLRIGAVHLGALNLYRLQPGPLSDDQHTNTLVMADVICEILLSLQADAPPGVLSSELEENANLRFVVAQASGMVSIQLDVSVAQALIRLRSYAFVHHRHIDEVANDVIENRVWFDDRDDE